jgi:tripartite-type tricarboxylate transporter receptor subunit TctC
MTSSNLPKSRRSIIKAAGYAALLLEMQPLASFAQPAWPIRPITIVVPFASGGSTDTNARLIAKVMSVELGQPVIIESKPGAGGLVGSAFVARSAPDGYTLLWGGVSNLAVAPHLYKNMKIEPLRSFVPIGMAMRGTLMLASRNDLPPRNAREFVSYARTNKGKVRLGSGGSGTFPHLAGLQFQEAAGIEMLHVPYKGGGPALTDLMGGHIDVVFDSADFLLPHVQAGRIRAYAVMSGKRYAPLPDVPTVAETLGKDFDEGYWHGWVAPVGTPAPVLAALTAALRKVDTNPEFRSVLQSSGLELGAPTAEEYGQTIARDLQKWGALITRANIQVEQ